ncbi:hypothetical protein [Streptosporangium sp. NBC_01756]|uniref:hypothetical protein n=1 Tax=Streptosporangium sp. NBC_01756 TaxID=2975950 RepID=UPI002DD8B6E1|nr:hypothetical protein [Streptosporangium sp. NBC_01756]WSC90615.1 hypothetical protein OIE48_21440 [Streptosporangium sp. NBC_01756]
MYRGALGKRGNRQIGVRVNLVSDRASPAVNCRLFLPESRDDLTRYAVLRELQALLATWTGACSICGRPAPTPESHHRA